MVKIGKSKLFCSIYDQHSFKVGKKLIFNCRYIRKVARQISNILGIITIICKLFRLKKSYIFYITRNSCLNQTKAIFLEYISRINWEQLRIYKSVGNTMTCWIFPGNIIIWKYFLGILAILWHFLEIPRNTIKITAIWKSL